MEERSIKIIILYGGRGEEREISIISAENVAHALGKEFEVEEILLDQEALPEGIAPHEGIVFPLIHGDFGEDGRLQKLLEEKNFVFVGSGSYANSLFIDKKEAKVLAKNLGLNTLPFVSFPYSAPPDWKEVEQLFGGTIILKPTNKGSSVGVKICRNFNDWQNALKDLKKWAWMIEPYLEGAREVSVGILNNEVLGVVEIIPKVGFYDYGNKYTRGACTYEFPAKINPELDGKIKSAVEKLFKYAGCLDFARADFLIRGDEALFMEMNTIPGMTESSLITKSAACNGYSLDKLLHEIVQRSLKVYRERYWLF